MMGDSSRVKPMPQITARLSPEARQSFEKYAASVGLKGSALARLLIVRALRRRANRPSCVVVSKPGTEEGKLTAHSCSAETVAQFDAYAKARGLSRAAAAKFIFERELRDRWLIKAMCWKPGTPRFRTSRQAEFA
jgi:hypothetical protein